MPLHLEDDHHCFACGMKNPDGLRIEWKINGTVTTAEFVPERKHQGWKGIVHGGILATLLDEAMTRLAALVCGDAVTAEMTVRYVAPAPVGMRLFIRGEIVSQQKRLVEMKATLSDAAGKVIAHSVGKAVISRSC